MGQFELKNNDDCNESKQIKYIKFPEFIMIFKSQTALVPLEALEHQLIVKINK